MLLFKLQIETGQETPRQSVSLDAHLQKNVRPQGGIHFTHYISVV